MGPIDVATYTMLTISGFWCYTWWNLAKTRRSTIGGLMNALGESRGLLSKCEDSLKHARGKLRDDEAYDVALGFIRAVDKLCRAMEEKNLPRLAAIESDAEFRMAAMTMLRDQEDHFRLYPGAAAPWGYAGLIILGIEIKCDPRHPGRVVLIPEDDPELKA